MHKYLLAACLLVSLGLPAFAAQPVVAIHVSELTQALETTVAKPPTPTGWGTTGYEWWMPSWHYYVITETVQEALRSDGTAFVIVSDADIASGNLLNPDGSPKYPIVISLAAEAVGDDEILPLNNYVSAGGFLFIGSSAFTRHPDGTTRSDFALATSMGLHIMNADLQNWTVTTSMTTLSRHRLVAHIPTGTLSWRMPVAAEDTSWNYQRTWQTSASDATVLATADNGTLMLAAKPYGNGYFLYDAAMQPLMGYSGYAPGMYSYGIFRSAIEWAFENASLPIVKLSPWPYPYNSAMMIRHDFENVPSLINSIESSAQTENSFGAKGDYYFCTGTLRVEMANDPTTIASLRRAVSQYGATIGSHNGGLPNPNYPGLPIDNYNYWHWGIDDALDAQVPGYPSGSAYALTSVGMSFADIDGWMNGLSTNTRIWVSPWFSSTREGSYQVLEQAGAITAGEQKLTPFPHWTLSTQTRGKHYSFLSLPTSEWYLGPDVAQSMESGYTPTTVHEVVDAYYNLGALINLYSHQSSQDTNANEYLRYTTAKPNVWATNAASVYQWWTRRTPVQIAPTHTVSGGRLIVTTTLSGVTDPDTALEFRIPDWAIASADIQVKIDGAAADPSSYRFYGQGIKVRAGATASSIEVSYPIVAIPHATNDSYTVFGGDVLSVTAPGVLGNDTYSGGGALTATLVAVPSHGALTFNPDGSFTYTPTAGFKGTDSFTYYATASGVDSNLASVAITGISLNVTSVTLNPSSVQGGDPSTGTVMLSGSAPASGITVMLTSSDATTATVPASVTVLAGASTANFPVTTIPVGTATSGIITASLGGSTQSATLTVTPPMLTALTLAPTSVLGGSSSTGTVTLSGLAPAPGMTVALTSSDPTIAPVPASVTVPAGASTATFGITTHLVASTTSVTISASLGAASQSATLTVTPLPVLSSLSLNPTSVRGGSISTGTITLNAPAPSGGSVISLLSSDSTVAAVPATVTVAANASTATFTVTTSPVVSNVSVTISAAYNNSASTAALTVTATGLNTLSLSPTSVRGGSSSTGTITLNGPAPAGGVVVSLASTNRTLASVPASVTVAANATTATFTVTTTPVGSNATATISASYAGVTRSVVLTVTPASLTSMSLNPNAVYGGASSTGTVLLTGPAPAGGALVTLTSNNSSAATVPANVIVPANATTATFPIATIPVASNTSATITSSYRGANRSATLSVRAPVLNTLTLNPTSVKGGTGSIGTVTLNAPAPAAGAVVTLTSSRTSVATVPYSVTVPADATTATFAISTRPVTYNTSSTLSATYRGTTRRATLTVTP